MISYCQTLQMGTTYNISLCCKVKWSFQITLLRRTRSVLSTGKKTLMWRRNGHDNVSNHQPHGCLFNCLIRRRSKKTSKLRVTGLCAGNPPGTGEFPAQMVSNAENFPFDDVIMLQVGCDQQYFNCCLASTQILVPGHSHFAYIWSLCQVMALTHWGRMTHICRWTMSSLVQIMDCRLIGAIISINDEIFLNGHSGANLSENSIDINCANMIQ